MTTNDYGWVVDASVILKWSLRDAAEDFLEEADALYEAFLARRIDLIAPCYARYEVASGLEIARLQQRIDLEAAEARLRWFLRTSVSDTEDDDSLLIEAMDLAQRHAISLYDAIYVALAERLDYTFVTADSRLYKRIATQTAIAKWIGDIPDLL
jgi:predicted nucleic acid-binding protein